MAERDTSALDSGATVLCTVSMAGRPLRDFLEAAGVAGFSAVSLSAVDYEAARESGLTDADIRVMLADNGLVLAELDGIPDFLRPVSEAGADFGFGDHPWFEFVEADYWRIADALGPRSVTVVDSLPGDVPTERTVEAFAGVCDRAAEHGLTVHLEHLSWGPVPNLATAWEVVRQADRPNGGLTVDTLHLIRSGSMDLLAQISGEKIFSTQFCDGPEVRALDPFADAANRLFPGEGEFELVQILRTLESIGSRAPIGVEVVSSETKSMSALEIATRARDSLERLRAGMSAA